MLTVESILWAALGGAGTVIAFLYQKISVMEKRRDTELEALKAKMDVVMQRHSDCERDYAELRGRVEGLERREPTEVRGRVDATLERREPNELRDRVDGLERREAK